jgi:hypothetical protein
VNYLTLVVGCAAKAAAIVCVAALLSPPAAAQETSADFPRFAKDEARGAIDYWKEENKLVKLDRLAQRSIQAAFTAPHASAKQASAATDSTESTDDFVVGAYLDELRDRKYAKVGAPTISKRKIELTAADVDDFSVAKFIAGMPGDVWPHPGEMTVISFPPGALISIDGNPRGMANKDFVLPKGKHDIVVHSQNQTCSAAILVMDDLFLFRCPAGGQVPAGRRTNHPQ